MYPYDLGRFSRPVTTTSPEAQLWFDRGLIWSYGFNHDEAVRCFRRALEHDPACAMAHWGVATASGPNYNMPWEVFDDRSRAEALAAAFDATQAAMACLEGKTEAERALVAALPERFRQRDADGVPVEAMAGWDDAFAARMRTVQAAFPADLDIRTVTVEAMMQRTPWAMWDIASGQPMQGADTVECRALIEEALEHDPRAWAHPGLLHLCVHLMEMSPTPEAALKAGDVLRTLVPDAGHLVHMATHVDVQVGAYRDTVFWNERAIAADLKYFEREGAYNLYTGYRLHNYHFVLYGTMFLGQIEPALRALKGMDETTPEAMLRIESPPMADYFESYLSFHPHVLVRFGRWDEAIALEPPADPVLFCTLTAHVHYARTVAFAALGRVDEALLAERDFLSACDAVPETRLLHNCRVIDLLEIGKAMARGEILYRQGAHDAAFAELRRAVSLEDALPYDEPWGWMQPSRHALGALLLEQGRVAEAEAAFREDLGLGGTLPRAQVHPDNVWALRGLHDCLVARGETAERAHVRKRLDLALARADGAVGAACFCAQAASRCCGT